jgi:hypothetical protein
LDQLETGEHIPGGSPVLKARNEMRDKSLKASRKETLKTLLDFWDAYLDWQKNGKKPENSYRKAAPKSQEIDLVEDSQISLL